MNLVRCFLVCTVLVFASACNQEPTAVSSRSSATGGANGRAQSFADFGLSVEPPAKLSGKFARTDHYTWAFEVGRDAGVFGDAIYVGELPIDEAGLTAILLWPYRLSFPGERLFRLPSTEEHGLQWRHYLFDSSEVKNRPKWQKLSVTRAGDYVYTVVASSISSDLPWMRERLGSFYQGVSVEPKSGTANLMDIDKKESMKALEILWLSNRQRGRYQSCVKVAEAALKISSTLDWAILLLESHINALSYSEGLGRANELLAKYPGAGELLWRRAVLAGEVGNKDEALADYRTAIFTKGDRSKRTLASYINYLDRLELLGDRIIEVEELVEGQYDPELMLLLARAYFAADMKEKARKVMSQLTEMASAVPEAASQMIQLYLEEDDFKSALELSNHLSGTMGDPLGNFLAGITLIKEGRYGEARKELQAFLVHEPGHAGARHHLEFASSMLGKADTTFLKQPIDPVPTPVGFLEEIEDADPAFAGSYGYYCRYRGVMHSFHPNQRFRTTRYMSYVVTDRKGLEAMSEFSFPYDPLYERIYVNSLRVYGSDGEMVAEGDLENYYLSNEDNGSLATQRKELHLPVPGVDVGSRVEIVVSWETLGNQSEMPFKNHLLTGGAPIQLGFAGVIGDVDALEAMTANGVEQVPAEKDQLVYAAKYPMVYPVAANLPPAREFLPTVWIGTAGKKWDAIAKDYIEKTREHYEVDPVVKAKAEELVDPEATLEEKVQVLTRFVRDSLTYQGIEFGVRAQIPNKCSDILTNRYGDCKDHTFLLMQLLRASGVSAVPALVDSSLEMNPKLADLNQFDHMILYVPDFRGGHFIDPTDKNASIGAVPSGLADQPALVLDAENPALVTIESYRPDSSVVIIDRALTLDEESGAMVRETVELSGNISSWVRGNFKQVAEAEYALILGNMLGVPYLKSLKNVTASNLDDREKPVQLSYEYDVDRQFYKVGELLTGKIPATWELAILQLSPIEQDRKAPIWQRIPAMIESRVSLAIPDGYKLSEDLPVEAITRETEFGGFEFNASQSGNIVLLDSKFTTRQGIYPAEKYLDRRKVFEDALNVVEHPLALVRESSAKSP